MAFQAERIGGGRSKQVCILTTVRRVAGSAPLLKGRLMQVLLLEQVGYLCVAAQANRHIVRLGKPRTPARMGIVAIGALTHRPGMLHLCLLDLLCLISVATDAKLLRARRHEHHLVVFRLLMAGIAGILAALERSMHKCLHQFWTRRFMRVVALNAISRRERLIVMCLAQVRVLGVVTIEAELGRGLCKMIGKVGLTRITSFVDRVAAIASHVERGMPASLFRHIGSGSVATQAEIL